MKNKFLRNASAVIAANSICIVVNIIISFLIPIFFDENAYSYYQLENLYCGYLWIFTLGWHEGVYMHYGGELEKNINKNEISTQFWLLAMYLIIIAVGINWAGSFIFGDAERQYVLFIAMLSIMLEAIRYVFLHYLVCINNMKSYSKYMIADRIVYVVLVVMLLILGFTDYKVLLGIDILSKAILLILILFLNKELFFRKLIPFKESFVKTRELISSGVNVTSAMFVSRFVMGTVRTAIDIYWGILVFGKISLTLSISNMFSQFIQAISVVLFPELRRTSDSGKKKAYAIISDLLDCFMLTSFVLYLPGVKILNIILPQYADGLRYMAILFPVCLFDARNTVLNNTYLKTLHKEKGILMSNFIAVGCSLVFTYITVFVLHSLELAVVTMVLLVGIKCYSAEIILSKTMDISLKKHMILEISMIVLFIMANWYISGIYGMLLYGFALIIYYIIQYKNIKGSITYLKVLKE